MSLLHQATVISMSPVRLVVATIYSDILNVTQKTGYRFNSFEILMINVTLSDMQKKSVLSLALATVYRAIYRFFKRICRFPLRPIG